MNPHEPIGGELDALEPLAGFRHLMPFQVGEILLVSSLYDSFILHEDGRLNELIVSEFFDLNLRQTPGLTHVSSGEEALARVRDGFHLVITTIHPGDMDAAALARGVRAAGLDTPVIALGYDSRELSDFMARNPATDVSRFFLWQGDARILLAIVKSVEDERNAPHDTQTSGVRVILVVEDNVHYYSSFLPMIYTELISQSQRLISEGVNLAHKVVRMRARPKILLANTWEEAWQTYVTYRKSLLGVISDVEFPREGRMSDTAGFELAARIKGESPDVPILLQSGHPEVEPRARASGGSFLLKGSPTLLADLRAFMVEQFAFGDFVFRRPDGTEVDRAGNLKALEEKLRTVPADSVAYHAERDHFSNWLTARTEFALARKLKPRKVEDFPTYEDLRRDLIASIAEYRREQAEVLVSDFDPATFDAGVSFFSRIGGGSLGGKARGLAFVRHLLNLKRASTWYDDVRIAVPPSVVIGTDVFDRFVSENGLLDFAIHSEDDRAIGRAFEEAFLPAEVLRDIARFLELVRCPIAVRSSSLLEDSQYRPFTGVYATVMLPNNHPDPGVRLRHLVTAVKRVYASMFSAHAKAYFRVTPYRLEEEKMAVILQKLVGAARGKRFYPDFAGVARSHNFYPAPPQTSEDGIAAAALGLGRTVVDGEKCLSFCPRYPRNLVQFSSVADMLSNSQRSFWALEIDEEAPAEDFERAMRETRFDLDAAEVDGTLAAVASTYSEENQVVYDGLSRPGVRLVSFAPVLKHDLFPLAGILARLLEIGSRGMGRPVEIEFAARLARGPGEPMEFGFLQMRPLVLAEEDDGPLDEEPDPGDLVVKSPRVLGNGRLDAIRDVVVVDFHAFDRARSADAALEVTRHNAALSSAGVPYILIGVGRWGSADPWLGIPVQWDQISGARVIVEAGFRDVRVEPSQGSHFFQNLTAFKVGYFTVNSDQGEGFVDWNWLARQPSRGDARYVRHLEFESPLLVRMDGRRNRGYIAKPRAASGS